MQELAGHLKESADIIFPTLSRSTESAVSIESALEKAQLPFVGSPAEALALTADRWR